MHAALTSQSVYFLSRVRLFVNLVARLKLTVKGVQRGDGRAKRRRSSEEAGHKEPYKIIQIRYNRYSPDADVEKMAAKSMLWVCSTLPQFLAELSQE
jgi:hypothetical protein